MKSAKVIFTILLLIMGGIFYSSCEKNSNEEDPLGASRPVPLDDYVYVHGLKNTEWREVNSSFNLYIDFYADSCTFKKTPQFTSQVTTTKFNYTFKYPNLSLTLKGEDEVTLKGVVTGIVDDRLIIKDNNSVVLYNLKRFE